MAKTVTKKVSAGPQYSLNTRLAIILAIAVLAVYANTFINGYVLDDVAAIVENKIVIGGISAIPEIFSTPYHHGFVKIQNDLYRPLSLAMFAIEYQLSDGDPMISHVINVIIFFGCVMLLFLFLDALFEKRKTTSALIAALLFALHPIHTEVVANIKSRDELLCFFFAFLSLNVFIKYADTGKRYLLFTGSVLFFLSLLSKETSLSFLLVVPFVFFFYRNKDRLRSIYITAGVAVSIAVFLCIRIAVLHAYQADHTFAFSILDNSLAAAPSLGARLATAVFILGKYLKLLFIPYPLICDYSFNSIPLTTAGNVWVILSSIAYMALLAVGIYRLIKRPKDSHAFGISFFLITLAMFSNIFFLVGATMAERFLFFPSAGFCIVVATFIGRWADHSTGGGTSMFNKRLYVMLIPIALLYGGITIARNRDWQDGYTLYKADIDHAGDNYRIPNYLGSYLINESNSETDPVARKELHTEAVGYLKRSIAVYPYFSTPYSQIGIYYTNYLQPDSAILYDKKALALDSRDTFTRNNLAAVYFKVGRYREAIDMCRQNIIINPDYARAYLNIGTCYLKLSIPDSAVMMLKRARQLEPGIGNAAYFISVAYTQAGNPDSAKKYEAIWQQGQLR